MMATCSFYWGSRLIPWWIVRVLRIGLEFEIEDITKPGDFYTTKRNTGRRRLTVFGRVPLTRYTRDPAWRFAYRVPAETPADA